MRAKIRPVRRGHCSGQQQDAAAAQWVGCPGLHDSAQIIYKQQQMSDLATFTKLLFFYSSLQFNRNMQPQQSETNKVFFFFLNS
jgi:hypothetical protein